MSHMFNVGCHSIRWGMTIDETGPGSVRVCLDHGALPPSPSREISECSVQRTLEGLNSKRRGRWASYREPLPSRPKVMQNPHSAGNDAIAFLFLMLIARDICNLKCTKQRKLYMPSIMIGILPSSSSPKLFVSCAKF